MNYCNMLKQYIIFFKKSETLIWATIKILIKYCSSNSLSKSSNWLCRSILAITQSQLPRHRELFSTQTCFSCSQGLCEASCRTDRKHLLLLQWSTVLVWSLFFAFALMTDIKLPCHSQRYHKLPYIHVKINWHVHKKDCCNEFGGE